MNAIFMEVNLPNSTLTQKRKVSQQEYFKLMFSGKGKVIPKKKVLTDNKSEYYQLKKERMI